MMRGPTGSRQGGERQGFGLVELLVAIAIGGVVLAVVASFFSFQTRISRETQARNELNVRARAVAEAIAQDLRMAGSRAAVDDRGVVGFARDPAFCGSGLGARCVDVPTNAAVGMDWVVSVVYVSSLFLDGADVDRVEILCDGGPEPGPDNPVCRRVDYFLGPGDDLRTLYRRDVERGADGEPSQAEQGFAFEFATGIRSIDIAFVCGEDESAADDGVVDLGDPARCFGGELNLIREARVSVVAESERVSGLTITQDTSTAMLNLRAPDRFR